MSNSPLAKYVDISTTNWNYRQYPITRITIHHAAGVCGIQAFSSILKSGREVSYNYAIANDGTIGLFVEENHRAWTSSSPDNDHRAITIEVSNSTAGGDWPVSSAAYSALLNLCTDICKRNNIKELTYTGRLEGSNLTMHCWFAATGCPGPYLTQRFPEIARSVNGRLKNGGSSSSTVNLPGASHSTAYDAATGVTSQVTNISTYDLVNKLLNEMLHPYIIGIDRNTNRQLDYKALYGHGVVAAIIEAGFLYNTSHKMVKFESPQFATQVKTCKSSNTPFALYMTTRARTITEAYKEIKELTSILRMNSPSLGMWLSLDLKNDVATNDKIIATYQPSLEKLGLKDKIGFYVTRAQLKQITWSRWQNSWYLWIRDNVSSTSKLDNLLTPEFFKL